MGVAQRLVPDSTNASLPYDAQSWQRSTNDDVKALFQRIIERPSGIAGTNDYTGTCVATDAAAITSYGPMLVIRPGNTNTSTAVRVNIDGIGFVNVLDSDGNAIAIGAFVAARDHLCVWDPAGNLRVVANGPALPPVTQQPGPKVIDVQTAASLSSLTFTTGINNTYDRYRLVIDDLKVATDDVQLLLQVGTGGGPTFQTAGYKWVIRGYRTDAAGGGALDNNNDSDSAISLTYPAAAGFRITNASGASFMGEVEFSAPWDTASFINFRHSCTYQANAAAIKGISMTGGGYWSTIGAITALRLKASSGNLVSGTGRLLGWPKT